MKRIDPKQYTIQTIRYGSKKRIAKVLLRYWKLKDKIKTDEIYENAKKIFKG